MPEINELKVFQTGKGEGGFEALTSFIAKMMSMAENLGIPASKLIEKRDSQPESDE